MMHIKYSVKSYWLFKAQSRLLQADRFVSEVNEKENFAY